MSKRNSSSSDVVSSVNNLKLVFTDGYLDYKDVVIVVRNHPALVRRILSSCNRYAELGVKQDGFLGPVQFGLYFRECLFEIILEYINSDVDFFSKSQKRKINRIPHPVISDFNFY